MHRARLTLALIVSILCLALSANAQDTNPGPLSEEEERFIEHAKKRGDDPGGETPSGPGPVFYFSPKNGNDANDCRTREKPCKTGDKLVKVVREPGSFALWERGTRLVDHSWIERMSDGIEGAPITVGVYGEGARPIFIKGRQTSSSSTIVRQQKYIVFDRLDFRRAQAFHIIDSSHHLDFIHTAFREFDQACVHIGGERDKTEAHNLRFINNLVEKCGLTGKNGEGFYISESLDRFGKGGRDILIKDTVIRNTQHEPVNIKSGTRRVRVEGVVIYDYVPNRTDGKRDPGLINARLSDDPKAGHVFTKNIIVGNKGHGSNKDAAFFLVEGTLAINNLVLGNSMACVRGDKGGKFFLNTCARNVRGFLNPEPVRGRTGLNIADVRCNIGTGLGNNIPDDKDQFVDLDHGDLRLRKDNSTIAGGCGLTGEMTDILDRKRPRNWGFGAFTYTGTKPPPPPPGGDCGALFGKAPGFRLCSETDTTCSFQATTAGTTCEGMCQSMGSTCIEAFNNRGTSCTAEVDSEDTCQTPRKNEICVCSKTGEEPPPPVKPEPVSVSWCKCGCAGDEGSTVTVVGLEGIGLCKDACAACEDGRPDIVIDKDSILGPVVQ